MEEYENYDGLGLAELVRTRQVTADELLDAALARVDARNPVVNAVVSRLEAEARSAIEAGLPDGPFAGVPFLVKDLATPVGGQRSTEGSLLFANAPAAAHDAEIVRRHRRAGLVIFGKTNTPEFGLNASTEPALFGPTRNPWNPLLTAGGSSRGSAAAVASGMVPMAHGTDGGGSIRIPASACGVFGLKPTRARTPLGPDIAEGPAGTLHVHALTRTVRDSATLLDVTAGADQGDPYCAPPAPGPFSAEVGRAPGRLRIALSVTAPNAVPVDAECQAAALVAARLCGELGHYVEEAAPPYSAEALDAAFRAVMTADVAAMLDQFAAMAGGDGALSVEPVTRALAEYGRSVSGPAYATALWTLRSVGRQVAGWFETYDVLLTPTLAQPPPALGTLSTLIDDWIAYGGAIFGFAPFTSLFNVTGQPAMSVPLHWTETGLPIGVQFAARFGEEATLFRLAAQLEEARPWKHRRPGKTS